MKNVNYEKIMQLVMTNIEASDAVNDLVNKLIKELQIQTGFGLAGFLKEDSKLDNFAAVRAWVNKRFPKIDTGDFEENYRILKHEFIEIWA